MLVVQEAGIAVVGGGADVFCANIPVGTAVAGEFQMLDVKSQMLLAG